MTTAVTVVDLFVYPVKSARGIAKARARLAATGFEGDRQWMLVDARGSFLSQRTLPQLTRIVPEITDDALVLHASGVAALRVPLDSRGEQVPVRVWKDACLGVDQGGAAHEWVSRGVGQAVRLVKPCLRCSIPSLDPRSGEPSTDPLPALRKFRFDRALLGVKFGENAVIAQGTGCEIERGAQCRVTFDASAPQE